MSSLRTLFHSVYLERQLVHAPPAKRILKRLRQEPILIDRLERVFSNERRKPYGMKARARNLIIAEKRGALVKAAPPAYGRQSAAREEHFYFIHAYNCIYACTYCYLQGYFPSPDLVLFINHAAIQKAIDETSSACLTRGGTPYFHSGEFSDSLALSALSGELESYYEFFRARPRIHLELRSKSAAISSLLALPPAANIITSFSLAPQKLVARHDIGTASLKARLAALSKLAARGYPVGVHLDPICASETLIADYRELAQALSSALGRHRDQLRHISLGTLRFAASAWKTLRQQTPFSPLLTQQWTALRGADGKLRYPRPLSKWLIQSVRNELTRAGFANECIYTAMETTSSPPLLPLSPLQTNIQQPSCAAAQQAS